MVGIADDVKDLGVMVGEKMRGDLDNFDFKLLTMLRELVKTGSLILGAFKYRLNVEGE